MRGLILRVDDRLIHGQVLYGFVNSWHTEQIWLANDRVASDPGESSIYNDLIAQHVSGGVLSIDDTISRFTGIEPSSNPILIVLETCWDLVRLIRGGIRPVSVHVGNLARSAEKQVVSQNVSLSPADLVLLDEVQQSGIQVSVRDLPGSDAIPLRRLLEERNQ